MVAELRSTTIVPKDVVLAVRRAALQANGVAPAAVLLLRPRTVPKTSSGKLRRHAVRDALLRRRRGAGRDAPTETVVALSKSLADAVVVAWSDGTGNQSGGGNGGGAGAGSTLPPAHGECHKGTGSVGLVPLAPPQLSAIESSVRTKLGHLLCIEPSDVNVRTPLSQLGVDSFGLVELLCWAEAAHGAVVPRDLLLAGGTTPRAVARAIHSSASERC